MKCSKHCDMATPVYGKRSRFPLQVGHKKCRGCHGDVPRGRLTWCSNECWNRYEPSRVRYFCRLRDSGICCECGVDTEKEKRKFRLEPNGVDSSHKRFWKNHVFDRMRFDWAVKIYLKRKYQLITATKNRREKLSALGWPKYRSRDWWEMDHIIPFSEGGLTVIENVRTLCCVCHKKRTKKWHKERNK